MAEEYKFYDEDIEQVSNLARLGYKDCFEINIRPGTTAIHMTYDDIVHLAKSLGLVVYERDSAL